MRASDAFNMVKKAIIDYAIQEICISLLLLLKLICFVGSDPRHGIGAIFALSVSYLVLLRNSLERLERLLKFGSTEFIV